MLDITGTGHSLAKTLELDTFHVTMNQNYDFKEKFPYVRVGTLPCIL